MSRRLIQIGLLIISASVFAHETASAQSLEKWKVEGGLYGGALLAGKEIGGDRNRAGGEQLIASLGHGGLAGSRIGIHSAWLGFDANVITCLRAVKVANEFGVAFPNHGKAPVLASGDALVYPLSNHLVGGRLRPYLTTGAGAALISVDLDNINDQELHALRIWNAGAGVKVMFGESRESYVDLQLKNHRVFGSNNFIPFNARSLSIGVGHRF